MFVYCEVFITFTKLVRKLTYFDKFGGKTQFKENSCLSNELPMRKKLNRKKEVLLKYTPILSSFHPSSDNIFFPREKIIETRAIGK